jgi:hypothetical protein
MAVSVFGESAIVRQSARRRSPMRDSMQAEAVETWLDCVFGWREPLHDEVDCPVNQGMLN